MRSDFQNLNVVKDSDFNQLERERVVKDTEQSKRERKGFNLQDYVWRSVLSLIFDN